jgi:hypothetical protein
MLEIRYQLDYFLYARGDEPMHTDSHGSLLPFADSYCCIE